MKRILLLVLLILASGTASMAETRWCDVTGRGPQDAIIYPPIARAARVSGLVMGYLKFTPEGKVAGFEPFLGPAMLRGFLGRQLLEWTVQTKATGSEACQTLVVAEFKLCSVGPSGEKLTSPECTVPPTPGPANCWKSTAAFNPAILRIEVQAPLPCVVTMASLTRPLAIAAIKPLVHWIQLAMLGGALAPNSLILFEVQAA